MTRPLPQSLSRREREASKTQGEGKDYLTVIRSKRPCVNACTALVIRGCTTYLTLGPSPDPSRFARGRKFCGRGKRCRNREAMWKDVNNGLRYRPTPPSLKGGRKCNRAREKHAKATDLVNTVVQQPSPAILLHPLSLCSGAQISRGEGSVEDEG